MRALSALLLGGFLGSTASVVSGAELVKDIRTANGDVVVTGFASVGNTEFILTGGLTPSLYRSDGTPGGTTLVTAVDVSCCGREIVGAGSNVFFVAYTVGEGDELWKSDGTPAGTKSVADINPGAAHSNPRDLTNVNGTLFFEASDALHGGELWKSDGTPGGTVLVKDIVPGTGGSNPVLLGSVGGVVFFAASDGVHGFELWKSDGTANGTSLVKDVNPGTGDALSRTVGWAGNTFYFVAYDGQAFGLWKTDGTPEGTAPLHLAGTTDLVDTSSALVGLNGTLFFFAYGGAAVGLELWKSDGTDAGTLMVKDIFPGSGSSPGQSLTVVGNTLFFDATDGVHGYELWKSNGTAAGTVQVKDIVVGPSSGELSGLTAVGSTLFFSAADGLAGGHELWKSDGTAAGTVVVKDILPGGSSEPRSLVAGAGLLYFLANDGVHGFEPWRSDGSDAGTIRLADIEGSPGSSSLGALTDVGGKLFFTADDGVFGRELWTSDGTLAGTLVPKHLGPQGMPGIAGGLFRRGSAVWFSGYERGTGFELFTSDGTTAGTRRVADIVPGPESSSPASFTEMNGTLYLAAGAGPFVRALWKSDGTAGGTAQVTDASTVTVGESSPPLSVGDLFYFVGGPFGGLWKSDGTAAGTTLVKDFRTEADKPRLMALGNQLLFLLDGKELWTSDGTLAGTVPLASIPYSTSFVPIPVVYRGKLFLGNSAVGSSQGLQGLWRSDGTAGGTVLVKAFPRDPFDLVNNPSNITVVNDTLYFSALDDSNRYQLWKTDGTAEGTVMVKDLSSGNGSSPDSFVAGNGFLYFTSDDGVHGRELWRSNGTPEGTLLVQDIAPGALSSSPRLTKASGSRLFFTADDGVTGRELWTHVLPATPNISVSDTTVAEGNAGTVTATFTVSLSAPSAQTVTVHFATADDTATSPSDFDSVSGTVTFLPGDVAEPVAVTVHGDLTDEATERFFLSLSNPSVDAAILDGQAIGTIVNEDPSADVSVTKTDGVDTATPGQVLTYTIGVANAGPNDAPGVLVSDPIPAGLTNATWTCAASGGGSCGAASGSGGLSEHVDLPVGGSVLYTLVGTVSANPASMRNTATATLPPAFLELDPANNSATDVDTLACDLYTSLVADGRATPGTLSAGDVAWYGATLRTGASYSFELTSEGAGAPGVGLFLWDDGCWGTSTAVAHDTSATDPRSVAARASFTAAGPDGRYRLRVENTSGSSASFALRLEETTQYSAAWSTRTSYDTYYSLQNTTGAPVTGTLTLTDTTGALAGTAAFIIPPGRTAAINTLAMGAAREATGAAQLVHDGPPGAIVAQGAIANFSFARPYIQPVKLVGLRGRE